MTVRMRQPYLRYQFALPNAGTYPIPINLRDPIMDLMIKLRAQNGSTSNISNSLIDVLNRIDVIDGSDVLWSLDSEEIMANAYYHYKESLDMGIDERPDEYVETTFKIPFGIGRMHPEIALDPKQFANPTLVLDWNLANIRAVGVDAFVDDSLRLTVMADVIDEAPSAPTGWLMTKQIREFATKATGDEPVVLPSDYAYRTLYVRAFKANICPKAIITKAKHDLNEDKYIPFEIYTPDWEDWLKEWYGFWHQGYWYFVSQGATTRNPYLRSNLAASLEASVAASDPLLTSFTNCELGITSGLVADTPFHAKVDGSLPFETYAWPYGDPDDPEEWLQLESTDKSRLRLTQGTLDGTCQVFLTQHRMY